MGVYRTSMCSYDRFVAASQAKRIICVLAVLKSSQRRFISRDIRNSKEEFELAPQTSGNGLLKITRFIVWPAPQVSNPAL